MSSSDWGDIWTWASGPPPPTDPTKNWVETDSNLWSTYGITGSQLIWQKTNSDSGEMTGRFYDVPGGTSNLMRGRCKLQNNGNWNDRTGIFLGNPTAITGDTTGGAAQDEINGVLFGLYGNNAGATRDLYAWRIQEGAVFSLGYQTIPAVIEPIGGGLNGVFEFEGALMVDPFQHELGGYNGGVFDPNRITGTSYARPFVRWNVGTGYSTTTATYVWNGTNTVTSTDTSEVSVGDMIRGTGTINWYRVVSINPNVSVTVDITGRPTPPSWTNTADYFDPVVGSNWTDWQLMTEANSWSAPSMMKRMLEGEYHVGILTIGTGWGAGGTNQAVFDDVEFNKGTTP